MPSATNLILVRESKWDYDLGMFTLHKGDCEHCCRVYHYTLLHAGFGDYSYAYCDCCGMLATFGYSSSFLLTLPRLTNQHQVIDPAWEPFILPCGCGGHFRSEASPRCVFCKEPLSAEHAAPHIERNSVGAGRGWRWQKNWTETYCIALEDPKSPGSLRQVNSPFRDRLSHEDKPAAKKGWTGLFTMSR
jgi:hypothetical protein